MRPVTDKNDYEDPICPFDVDKYKDEPPVHSIDAQRVIDKLEEYYDKNDYEGAERHIKYWMQEAENGRDRRGMLVMVNEFMGLYRKTDRREDGVYYARRGVDMIDELGLGDSVTAGTTYINAATVYKEFGMLNESVELFEKARALYEKHLDPYDPRMGGLNNNMGITLAGLERYDEAFACYEKALDIMGRKEHGALEQAVTYLNMAEAVLGRDGAIEGADEIDKYLDEAQRLLELDELPRDGYYAYVCEKSAPTFGYFGRFLYKNELLKRAEAIYEGT